MQQSDTERCDKKTFPKVQLHIMAYIAYAHVPVQGKVYFGGKKY